MVHTLIVTQGELARQLLDSARTIAGELSGIDALCLDWGGDLAGASARLEEAVEGLDDGDGVLLLTDLHGGTPTNAARELLTAGRVEVVAGVNLPMIVRLACRCREERTLSEIADWIVEKGAHSIVRVAPCVSLEAAV